MECLKKTVESNENYIIQNDGLCFSLWNNRFIKQIVVKDSGKSYLVYNIRYKDKPKMKHTVARLVYYHFGLHDANSYENLKGEVVHIDGNLANNHIDNLILMSKSRINKHYNIVPKTQRTAEEKSKIKIDQKSRIVRLFKSGHSRNKIAKFYGVSEMSVLRFFRRNNIPLTNQNI